MRASRLFVLAGLATLVVIAPSAVAGSAGDYGATDNSFGSQALNSTTSTPVTITNNGVDHTISNVTLGGSNPGQFGVTNDNCSGTVVTAGNSCTVGVTFTPTSTGPLSAQLNVVDETGTTVGVASYDGTGVGTVTDGVAPSTWDFGSAQSATKTFTLSNNGTGTLTVTSVAVTSGGANFSVQSDNCTGTVSAGGQCTFDVQWTASGSGGVHNGNVHIADNAGGNDVSVSGTVSVASVNVSPGSIPFGPHAVNGGASSQNVTVTNNGSANVNVSSSSISGATTGAGFSQDGGCNSTTLAPGDQCHISVSFDPSTSGSKTGTLVINDSAASSPENVNLSGTGTVQSVNVNPSSISFNDHQINTGASTQNVTVTNNGNVDVTVSGSSVSGATSGSGLTDDNGCNSTTLHAGNQCTIVVGFNPTTAGSKTGNLVITDSAASSPENVNLSGTATSQSVVVNPGSIPFGSQTVGGGGTSQNVTVTNNGTAPVTVSTSLITNATLGAGFSQDGGCNGSTLQPGNHCTISVGFSPTTGGAKSGTLEIDDSTPNGPETVSLSGTGNAPSVSVGSLNFGNVLLGQTKPLTLTVQNNGTAPLHVASVVLNTGGTTNYTLSANTCTGATVAVNQSCTVNVAFHPVVSGGHAGDILVTDDAPTSPQNPTLTGIGLSQFVQITPATFNFPTQTVGKLGATQVFTLKNLDSVNLVISGSVAINPASANPLSFRVISGNCGGRTIAPSGTCTFTVQFTPGAAGALTAQARDTDSAPDSPHGVQLTGIGVHPPNITNLHGAVGCTNTTTLWTPATAGGLVGSWIERNASRVPRTPFDGTHLIHTRAGVLLDSGLTQFHSYYYAIWSLYRFSPSGPLIYSARSYIGYRTQRVCSPQNHATVFTTTPLIDWTSVPGAFAYGMRIYNHGSQIFTWAKRTTISHLQIQSSWTYRGVKRSLKKGENYQIFLYAYTDRHPDGFGIGTSYFSVR